MNWYRMIHVLVPYNIKLWKVDLSPRFDYTVRRGRGVEDTRRAARSAQSVGHAIAPEIQYLRLYSTGIQSVILLLLRKSQ